MPAWVLAAMPGPGWAMACVLPFRTLLLAACAWLLLTGTLLHAAVAAIPLYIVPVPASLPAARNWPMSGAQWGSSWLGAAGAKRRWERTRLQARTRVPPTAHGI